MVLAMRSICVVLIVVYFRSITVETLNTAVTALRTTLENRSPPARVISADNNGQLSLDTLTAFCYAQCFAACIDNQVLLHKCDQICNSYKTPEWTLKCQNDTKCIEGCNNEGNITTTDDVVPPPPSVHLTQTDVRQVLLTWHRHDVSLWHTVIYVIESRDNSEPWHDVLKTNKTEARLAIDVCTRRSYRVASVSQSGTHGFVPESTVRRLNLPKPGGPQGVRVGQLLFEETIGYFRLNIYWDPPRGWQDEDIERYILPNKLRNICAGFPPVPFVERTQRVNSTRTRVASLRIHSSGSGCLYIMELVAVSKCKLIGAPALITVDLRKCDEIPGLPCKPPKPVGPGPVVNVTVTVVTGVPCVRVSWSPPDLLGTAGQVHYYDLQWGLVHPDDPLRPLMEEGRVETPGNQTEAEICVNRTGVEYGVKVMARVDGISEESNAINRGAIDATFSIEEHKEFEGDKEESEDGGGGGQVGERDAGKLLLYIGVPIAMLVSLLVGVIVVRQRASQSRSRGPRRLTANNGDGCPIKQSKAPSSLVKNPIYQTSDQWEVSRDSLVLGEVLGRGAFGQVVQGSLLRAHLPPPAAIQTTLPSSGLASCGGGHLAEKQIVAVKMLLDDADERTSRDFLQEIELMKTIGPHPNVVSMLGCVTQQGAPACLIVEHMARGDLLHFLARCRHGMVEKSSDVDDHLTLMDLLSFARQIVVGMEFLCQRSFVHRDLATRNVLVGEQKQIKIGDFGLTRFIYDDPVYVTKCGRRLPLKWMAIEAIFELTFTTASDVWSFGVVLFELMTLGGVPYPAISNRDLLRHLQDGYRIEKPTNCPQELYKVMRRCWEERPQDRPTFTDLHDQLDTIIKELAMTDYTEVSVDETNDYYLTRHGSDTDVTTASDDIFNTSSRSSADLIHGVTLGVPLWSPGSESSGISTDHHGHSPGSHISFDRFMTGRSSSECFLNRPPGGQSGSGKERGLLRMSTCSQDGLLGSSLSEGFGSDGSSVYFFDESYF